MKYKLFTFAAFISMSSICYAENPVVGAISIISALPTSSSHLGAGYTEFRLAEVSLDTPCTWLHIKPEDKSILSILLTAQAQQKEITAYYDPSLPSPWASGSCRVTIVQISN